MNRLLKIPFIKNKGIFYILAATFFGTLMSASVKYLSSIHVLQIIFFRSIITLIICTVEIKRQNLSFWGNNKKYLILRGLSGTIGLILYYHTLQEMPLLTAYTVQKISPIFTVLFAFFLFKELMTWQQFLAVLIAFLGILMVRGVDLNINLSVLGIGILAAAMTGFSVNFIRKLKKSDHPLTIIFYYPIVTLPIIAPFISDLWIRPNLVELFFLILVGIFTQFSQYFFTRGIHEAAPAEIAPFFYAGTIYSFFISMFLFGERYDLLQIVGVVTIVLAMIYSAQFEQKKAERT